MSVFLDRKFLLIVSPKLQRFVKKKDDLYNFRCPLCGDSQKNKTKSRGYVYRKKNSYFYMCHNCGASTSFFNFLKQVDPSVCDEYTMEKYKSENGNTNTPEPDFTEVKKSTPDFSKDINLPSIINLPEKHFAKEYITARKIPVDNQSDLYYTDDFKSFVETYTTEYELIANDKRIIIPFRDKDGKLTGFQGRALGESLLRYITIKLIPDGPMLFGMNKIDLDDVIYVVEGPIDSMFIKNAVAIGSSNLQTAVNVFDKQKLVLVYDNEPRNVEITHLLDKSITEHFNVVIWPTMIQEKDINDMILSGLNEEDIMSFLKANTFNNLRAKFEFVNWKKT